MFLSERLQIAAFPLFLTGVIVVWRQFFNSRKPAKISKFHVCTQLCIAASPALFFNEIAACLLCCSDKIHKCIALRAIRIFLHFKTPNINGKSRTNTITNRDSDLPQILLCIVLSGFCRVNFSFRYLLVVQNYGIPIKPASVIPHLCKHRKTLLPLHIAVGICLFRQDKFPEFALSTGQTFL